jgi:hypothetical protein
MPSARIMQSCTVVRVLSDSLAGLSGKKLTIPNYAQNIDYFLIAPDRRQNTDGYKVTWR